MKNRTVEFTGSFNRSGKLFINNFEKIQQFGKDWPNIKIIGKLEIILDTDITSIRTYYKEYIIPELQKAMIESGDNVTTEQCDNIIRGLSPITHKRTRNLEINEMDTHNLTHHIEWIKQMAAEYYNYTIE